MSVVIIGGNERMVCQYADICKCHGCKAKVFAKEHGSVRKKIGCPDLLILFTNTVSHKMVNTAIQEAKRNNIPVARIHSSSASALHSVLEEHAGTISDRTLFADAGIGEDGKFVYLVFCTGGNARAAGRVLESGITGEGDFTCCPESTESEGTDVCMSQTETAGAAR